MDAQEVRRRQVQVERYLRQPEGPGIEEGVRAVSGETAGGSPKGRQVMKRGLALAALPVLAVTGWLLAQPSGDPIVEGFRNVEVASVADAMEQLYGQKAYMSHDMRPLFKTKFAGPAVTVLLKKE